MRGVDRAPANRTKLDAACRTAIIVPFKGKGRKSRLNPALGEEGADRLARLLLEGVLGVLAREGLTKDSYVVTSDGAAASAASRLGVEVVAEGADSGVDGAVRRALGALPERDSFLVIPSDLPLLSGGDLRAVLLAGSAGFLVLAPSAEFNGTNAMLFARGSVPELSYDRNSFWNHLGSASARGLRSFVYTGRGVVFDVDTVEDVSELALSPLNTPTVAFAKKVAAGWRS